MATHRRGCFAFHSYARTNVLPRTKCRLDDELSESVLTPPDPAPSQYIEEAPRTGAEPGAFPRRRGATARGLPYPPRSPEQSGGRVPAQECGEASPAGSPSQTVNPSPETGRGAGEWVEAPLSLVEG